MTAPSEIDPERVARQPAAIARLVRVSLSASDPAVVMREAARLAGEALGVEHAAVFELDAAADTVVLRAGTGWAEGVVGRASLSAGATSAAGAAIEAGEVTVLDLPADPRFPPPSLFHEHGIVSGLSMAIQGPVAPLGVLGVYSTRRREFADADVLFLRDVAHVVATAIARQRMVEIAGTLAAVANELTAVSEPEPVAERMVATARRLLRVRLALLYRIDPATGELVCLAAAGDGEAPAAWLGRRLPAGADVAGLAIREGRALWRPDVLAAADVTLPPWAAERYRVDGHRVVAAAPVGVARRPVAALVVCDRAGRHFTDAGVGLLATLASQVATAIESTRLFQEALRRRREAEELARAARTLTETLDVAAVGRAIVDSVLVVFACESVALRLLRPDGAQGLVARAVRREVPSAAPEVLPPGIGVSGLAVDAVRAVGTADALADPAIPMTEALRARLAASPVRALLAVPLRAKERIIGSLSVADRTGRAYTDEEAALLQAFADHAATALESARLYEAAVGRVRQLSALVEVNRAVTGVLDQQALAGAILQAAHILLPGCAGYVLELPPGGQEFEIVAAWGFERDHGAIAPRPRLGVGLAGRAAETRQTLAIADLVADPRVHSRDWARAEGLASAIVLPLLHGGVLYGLLALFLRQRHEFSQEEVRLLESFATQAAAAAANARLYAEAEGRRREAEASGRRFSDLVEGLDAVVWEWDEESGRVLYLSHRVEALIGYERGQWLEGRGFWASRVHPEDREEAVAAVRAAMAEGRDFSLEYRFLAADGRVLWLRDRVTLVREPGHAGRVFRGLTLDITAQKSLEAQLRQAQKMEAVGQLAGGVAHDFNNLLTIITGRTDLALGALPPGHPLRRDLDLIQKTADRAAALVRQLLAFSRKQLLQPRILDLNQVVASMGAMLRRLIGEDVELVTVPADDLGRVRADPSQVEQVIVNLAVNARDAMPGGGRLIIETGNADLGADYVREHPGGRPGAHVMLAVTDTGTGMDAATRAHIFEPFFTTKEQGKGTGLGLATVYGIVKQSGGNIWVYSEPGRGTSFKIYLPRVDDADASGAAARAARPARGSETVLLVEDEAEVRELARDVLGAYGYTVLEARTPDEALALGGAHPGPIHLLVTDVVMPRLGGPELAARLLPLRPALRVLYMSGYTDEAIVRGGLRGPGAAFLAKPFTPAGLARKVRELLEGS